jgi:hypothetical protein
MKLLGALKVENVFTSMKTTNFERAVTRMDADEQDDAKNFVKGLSSEGSFILQFIATLVWVGNTKTALKYC